MLGLAAAAFAPLAALMVVGLTVRRSMLESARHIVAVLIGAVPRCRLSRMLAFGGERPGYLAG